MSMNVRKGEIASIDGNRARVKSLLDGRISSLLSIPKHIDKRDLPKGTKVAFVIFEDATGAILAIM